MKISQFIEILKKHQAAYGDMRIMIDFNYGDVPENNEPAVVAIYDDQGPMYSVIMTSIDASELE